MLNRAARDGRLPRVLFLCTGNAARSQMAEGWARHLLAGRVTACSAGTRPAGLDPRAVAVMAEAGVDIADHRSKALDELDGPFDLVVTVCDAASQACPVFPGDTRVVHAGFPDPPRLAASAPNEQGALDAYRQVRDALRAFVVQLPDLLAPPRAGRAP